MHPLPLPQTSTANMLVLALRLLLRNGWSCLEGPSQMVHAPAMCLSPRYCWHLVARSCLEGPSQMLQASLIAVHVAVLLALASLIAELVAAPASLIAASWIPCRLRSLLRSWMVPAMFLEAGPMVLELWMDLVLLPQPLTANMLVLVLELV